MKKLFFLVLILMIAIKVYNQDSILNKAIEIYNKGIEARQIEQFDDAINYFEQALQMTQELGDEATEIKENCIKILPITYFQLAAKLLKENKNKEALIKFKATFEIADKYENEEIKTKSSKIISQLYYSNAVNSFKKNNYDSALFYADESLKYNPDNYKAHQLKTGIYKEQKNPEQVYYTALKTIEISNKNNDKKTAENTMIVARDFLLKIALEEKNTGNLDKTIEYTKLSLKLDSTNATAYYLLSQTYTTQKKWNEVIKIAKEGLKYEKDIPEEKAKFYNELGNAYLNLDNKIEACKAFKNATYGPFKEYAEYQIKNVLKCQ